MKSFLAIFIFAFGLNAFAGGITVDGSYSLGEKTFDKDNNAQIILSETDDAVETELISPHSRCVLKFDRGTLEKTYSVKLPRVENYNVYHLPLIESCGVVSQSSLDLVVVKNSDGQVVRASIASGRSRNKWYYFLSQ